MIRVLKLLCLGPFALAALGSLVASEFIVAKRVPEFAEIERNAAEISADRVDASNEGRLVVVPGFATDGLIRDPDTGVRTRGLRLRRKVEMFQWEPYVEQEMPAGDAATNPTSKTIWSGTRLQQRGPIGRVRHAELNPEFRLKDDAWQASGSRLGAFELDPRLLEPLFDFVALDGEARSDSKLRFFEGRYYPDGDPQKPAVGHHRLLYGVVKASTITVVARQAGAALVPFKSKDGKDFKMTAPGAKGLMELVATGRRAGRIALWVARIGVFVFLSVLLAFWTGVEAPGWALGLALVCSGAGRAAANPSHGQAALAAGFVALAVLVARRRARREKDPHGEVEAGG